MSHLAPDSEQIYSISQLNQQARSLLEDCLSNIWVEGEISNFVCPSSGHWYFSLKDSQAQVSCAMFRGQNMRLTIKPANGMQVLARAKASLYSPRGQYQLIVDRMEESGDGALRRAFEALKKKLDKEGLFAVEHKQALPELPQCIGVVTSPTGAAIHDILTVLKRRFAAIPIIIYPTLVQGEKAAADIVKAIKTANQRKECDVLIVGRGGGSLEDLWPFNEEAVARAIFASKLPIISAVGHEIDVSIADLVADVRAATPSAAAELVSPDFEHWQTQLKNLFSDLVYYTHQHIAQLQQHLQHVSKRLRHPREKLAEQYQRLDFLEQRLFKAIQHLLHDKQQHLAATSRALHTISPLATLDRGYAIVFNQQQQLINSKKLVKKGERIETHVKDGKIISEVV